MDCDVASSRARFRSPPSLTPRPPPPPRPSQAWVRASVGELNLGRVSIDDVANRDPRDTTPPALTSPRSVRACLEHGVDLMLAPKRVSDSPSPTERRAPAFRGAPRAGPPRARGRAQRRATRDARGGGRRERPRRRRRDEARRIRLSPAPACRRGRIRAELGGGPLPIPCGREFERIAPRDRAAGSRATTRARAHLGSRVRVRGAGGGAATGGSAADGAPARGDAGGEAHGGAPPRQERGEVAQARRVDAARDAEKAQVDKKHRDAVFERIQR